MSWATPSCTSRASRLRSSLVAWERTLSKSRAACSCSAEPAIDSWSRIRARWSALCERSSTSTPTVRVPVRSGRPAIISRSSGRSLRQQFSTKSSRPPKRVGAENGGVAQRGHGPGVGAREHGRLLHGQLHLGLGHHLLGERHRVEAAGELPAERVELLDQADRVAVRRGVGVTAQPPVEDRRDQADEEAGQQPGRQALRRVHVRPAQQRPPRDAGQHRADQHPHQPGQPVGQATDQHRHHQVGEDARAVGMRGDRDGSDADTLGDRHPLLREAGGQRHRVHRRRERDHQQQRRPGGLLPQDHGRGSARRVRRPAPPR